MQIVYLRVSKRDESKQDPEQQLKGIVSKFNLTDYEILRERGSAYDMKTIHKRQEFFKILNKCFDSDKTTINDLYLGNFEKKNIDLYVWDYSRIIRNIELNLLFSLLSQWFKIKIHSYKDKNLLKESENETPTARLTRIMMNTISAFSSEEYSYTISTNTKKSYDKDGYSTYGTKWGNKFRGTPSNPNINEKGKVDMTHKEYLKLNKRIIKLKDEGIHPLEIIKLIKKQFKIIVSRSYVFGIQK